MKCSNCSKTAVTFLRYSGAHLCQEHFLDSVKHRVKREIRNQIAGTRPTKLAIALSGGKDSTVVTILTKEILGQRRDLTLEAITIDEGIEGYRPPSLAFSRELCADLGIPQHIVSFKEAFGHSIDEVVTLDPGSIPCSYCGVFRRTLLNRRAREIGADYLITGLNLDDTAQSVLMNVFRAEPFRLARIGPHEHVLPGMVPRLQPLRVIPEKEVYLYALLRGIRFHNDTCPNASRSMRSTVQEMVHVMEERSPGTRHSILSFADGLRPHLTPENKRGNLFRCQACGDPTSQTTCQACQLQASLSARKADPIRS